MTKDYINSLLFRVDRARRRVFDQGATSTHQLQNCKDVGLPEFSDIDIQAFKRIVETGVVTSMEYRPPKGYAVLSFLIALKNEQERRYMEHNKTIRQEMIDCLTKMWTEKIEASGGNLSAAKERMKKAWGDSLLSEDLRQMLNLSYESAKTSWETTIIAER